MNKLVDFRKRLKCLHKRIGEAMDWTDQKVDMWFATPNPACGNIPPIKFLLLRPVKCEQMIEAMLRGEGQG